MAGLWADNFLPYYSCADMLNGAWASIGPFLDASDGAQILTSNPPRAGYANFRLNATGVDSSTTARRIFGAAKTTAGVAFRMWIPALPAHEGWVGSPAIPSLMFIFSDTANGDQVIFYVGTDGSIQLIGGDGATALQRSVPCLTAAAWNHIEAKEVPGNPTGAFELRVNGVSRLNFSGRTQWTANQESSQFTFIGPGYTLSTGVAYMDIADAHAWDDQAGEGPTDFVGNVGVLDENLASDTADAGFALSTGSTGYTLLTDKSDSTYISAAAATVKSGFGVTSLPSGTAGIVYRQLMFRGLKTDAADCDIAPSFKSSGSETTVTGQPMTTAETWRWGISGKDPSTSAPWTQAGAAASEACVTRTL